MKYFVPPHLATQSKRLGGVFYWEKLGDSRLGMTEIRASAERVHLNAGAKYPVE